MMGITALSTSAQFISHPQNSFYKIGGNAGAKQHSQDDYIQEVLNPVHALGTIIEAGLNALVPLLANSLMDAQALVGFAG